MPIIINRLCFSKNGFLRDEFDTIFHSLFNNAKNHLDIIITLSKIKKGLTRNRIISKSKISSGGKITYTLNELIASGFIEKQIPFNGKKQALYRLTDEYNLFYLKFIKNKNTNTSNTWQTMYNQNSYKIWSGFSFENVCLKHIHQIKEGLKITGIYSNYGSWVKKNKKQGTQIDLLIDSADNTINICEIKFYNSKFILTKSYANTLREKVAIFKEKTKTKKNIFTTMITTYGVKQNKYSLQHIQNELTIEDLFINI